jgi:hypothetical protein
VFPYGQARGVWLTLRATVYWNKASDIKRNVRI